MRIAFLFGLLTCFQSFGQTPSPLEKLDWFQSVWHPTHYLKNFKLLPLEGSVPNEHLPWGDSYWPMQRGGMAYRWMAFQEKNSGQGLSADERKRLFFDIHLNSYTDLLQKTQKEIDELSPLEKFSIYIKDYHYKLLEPYLADYEVATDYWMGYCDEWTNASLHYSEPLPVTVLNPDGITLHFGSSDIKAILIANEVANRAMSAPDDTLTVGDRCNRRFQYPAIKVKNGVESFGQNPAETNGILDENYEATLVQFQKDALRLNYIPDKGPKPADPNFISKVLKDLKSSKCQGVRPEVFHLTLTNQLGIMNEGFALDKDRDLEIWNQPVFRYQSKVIEPTDPGSVHLKTRIFYADDTNYGWAYRNPSLLGLFNWSNPDSKILKMIEGFKIEYSKYSKILLSEGDEKSDLVYPNGIIDYSDYEYTLSLNSEGQVTGGKWLSFDRPDFLWIKRKTAIAGPFKALENLYTPIQLPLEQKPHFDSLDLK